MLRYEPPKGWSFPSIEELAAPFKGAIRIGPFGSALKKDEYSEGGIRVLGIEDVFPNKLVSEKRKYIPEKKYIELSQYTVSPGDILVTNMGTVGRTCVVPNDIEKSIISSHLIKLSLDQSFAFPPYISWMLNYCPLVVSQIESKCRGAIMAGFNSGLLKELRIPLPPLAEQRRIAAILDQADAICTKRREALAHLNELQQAIFIEMFGCPASNPKRFAVRKLGEIIRFEGGSQPPASTFTFEDGPDRIRLVQIRDFKTDRFKTYIPRSLCKRFFEEDDVMIGRYGPPVFQILRGLSGSYNVALMKAVPREGVTKDFVFHLLKEERLHSFVVANSERTAGQSGINLDLLENYQAYLPPLELQKEFSRKMAQLKSLSQFMGESQYDLDRLFSSLLHRAFHGEL